MLTTEAGVPVDAETLFYGSTITEDRDVANFCAEGLNIVTWQVYFPGCNLLTGTLKLTGTALDTGFRPPVI